MKKEIEKGKRNGYELVVPARGKLVLAVKKKEKTKIKAWIYIWSDGSWEVAPHRVKRGLNPKEIRCEIKLLT